MRKTISLIMILSLGVSLIFSGVKSASDKVVKLPTKKAFKMEPMNGFQNSNVSGHGPQHVDNNRDSYEFVQVDESKNGYGMIVSPTKPLYLNPEAGLFFVYRQWAGDDGTSGQIGASLCVDCADPDDFSGASWTTYTNVNGAYDIGRYPCLLYTSPSPRD